jgi:hypothetical protein
MVDILERQQSLGIEVYIAPAEDLPRELNRELNKDYLILDDRLLFCNETEQVGQQQRISIDKAEVEHMVRWFGILLRHAKKLDDVIDILKSGN